MSDTVMTMSLSHVSTLDVAARAVADTAGRFGLEAIECTQLASLLSEALATVIADSFDGSDTIDVDVSVGYEPGRVNIVLKQRGAPSTYLNGELPVRLETLLALGYAESMEFVSDGVRGSELRVGRSVNTGNLVDDPEFVAAVEAEGNDNESVDIDSIVIRPISSDDAVEVARLYFRTYGYTKIGMSWLYEPDVFRHKIETHIHEGMVAVLPSGRIVGHTGLLRPTPDSPTASGGPAAVDPAFRQRGIVNRLDEAFMPQILALGMRGIYVEGVTAHPASQAGALRVGLHETGLVLGRQPSDVEFIGFDGPKGFRRAVMILYRPLMAPVEQAVHVPARYRDILERIYEVVGLPRQIHSEAGRPPADLPPKSQFVTELLSATKHAQIRVAEYGQDFVEALQGLIRRFETERFEVITVHLPLMDPLTAYFGSGLGELGLSFNALFPQQDPGDELVLGVNLSEQDPETIVVASEFGRELLDYVIEDRDRVMGALQSRARSRASMARILDAL
ncbi:MAG: hypothetical protein ACO38Z_11330 [Candidatus Nanopelagicales bacterium]